MEEINKENKKEWMHSKEKNSINKDNALYKEEERNYTKKLQELNIKTTVEIDTKHQGLYALNIKQTNYHNKSKDTETEQKNKTNKKINNDLDLVKTMKNKDKHTTEDNEKKAQPED